MRKIFWKKVIIKKDQFFHLKMIAEKPSKRNLNMMKKLKSLSIVSLKHYTYELDCFFFFYRILIFYYYILVANEVRKEYKDTVEKLEKIKNDIRYYILVYSHIYSICINAEYGLIHRFFSVPTLGVLNKSN